MAQLRNDESILASYPVFFDASEKNREGLVNLVK